MNTLFQTLFSGVNPLSAQGLHPMDLS